MSNRSRKRAIVAAQLPQLGQPQQIDRRKQMKDIRLMAQGLPRIVEAASQFAEALRITAQKMRAMAELDQQKWLH